MKTVNEAAVWLQEHDHFLILTHRRPDGDAVGCAIALCLGLRAAGKQAHIWANPQFTPRYAERLAGLVSDQVEENTLSLQRGVAYTRAMEAVYEETDAEFYVRRLLRGSINTIGYDNAIMVEEYRFPQQ